MEKIVITANARNLILRASEEIITIAEDIKRAIETKDEIAQFKIEIINAKDYSKQEALDLIDKNKIATKWVNTIDENNNEALVIVLEKGGNEK